MELMHGFSTLKSQLNGNSVTMGHSATSKKVKLGENSGDPARLATSPAMPVHARRFKYAKLGHCVANLLKVPLRPLQPTSAKLVKLASTLREAMSPTMFGFPLKSRTVKN